MQLKSLLIVPVIALFFSSFAFAADTKPREEIKQVNYMLPYPGILPDNPLYPLKIFRDKIYGLLLSDPLKKANFKLLMADKRMAMSLILKDKGKPQLSETTISKASKYFEEAVIDLKKAQKEGRDINPLRNKLIEASQKYQEIIDNCQKYGNNDFKSGLQGSLTRIIKYRLELTEMGNKLPV